MRSCSSGGREVKCGKVVGVLSSLWKVGMVAVVDGLGAKGFF